MSAGRAVWAALRLLDRQLITNDSRMAGCVDDLELTASDDGNDLYVTAILSGPGALAYRLGHRRYGRWARRVHAFVSTTENPDPTRIPFNIVSDIGSHIGLGCTSDEVGTASAERWVRDHVISHIPGSDRAAE